MQQCAFSRYSHPPDSLQLPTVQTEAKPDSNFGGVQIGAITYSWRSMPGTADDLLKYTVQCGLSSVELMGEPAEQFAGAPVFERPRMAGASR